MAGDLQQLLTDVNRYCQNEVRPPIVENRSSGMSKFLSSIRPSRFGKWSRSSGEYMKSKFGHSKIRMGSYVASPTVGAVASTTIKGLILTGAAAITVKSFFITFGASAAVLALFIAIKAYVEKRRLGKYRALNDQQTDEALKLLGAILGSGELEKLCRLLDRTKRTRKKLEEELTHWNLFNSRSKDCKAAILLAWRFGWYKRMLTDVLGECESMRMLINYNDLLSDRLATLSEELADCGKKLLRNYMQFGYGCRNDPLVAYRNRTLDDQGILEWDTWFGELQLELSGQRIFPSDRCAGMLGYFVDSVGVKEKTISNFELLSKRIKSKFTTVRGVSKTVVTDLVGTTANSAATLIPKVMSQASLNWAHIGASFGKSFAAGLVPGIATAIFMSAATFAMEAIDDKMNLNKVMKADTPIIEKIWLLRSILEHGRVSKSVSLYGKMSKLTTKLKVQCRSLPRDSRGNTSEQIAKNTRVREGFLNLYKAFNYHMFCMGLHMFSQMMVDALAQHIRDETEWHDEQDTKVDIYLHGQNGTDHNQCRGTCYGDNGGGPIYPLS